MGNADFNPREFLPRTVASTVRICRRHAAQKASKTKKMKTSERIVRENMQRAKKAKSSLDQYEDKLRQYELKKKMMPNVVVEDSGPVDIIRDAKWVYENIGRLFTRDEVGLEYLDETFLATAPSNGAVSMAHYCWNHRKEFFEKFIFTKVVKEDGVTGQTDDDKLNEVDPTFAGLEKYLGKLKDE